MISQQLAVMQAHSDRASIFQPSFSHDSVGACDDEFMLPEGLVEATKPQARSHEKGQTIDYIKENQSIST